MRNVLFLCTENSARSILAEAILRQDGAGRFTAFSAGSHPSGIVRPLALQTLQAHGYPVAGLRSKSWESFAGPGSAPMHFVITVCDNAKGEVCPIWPGNPASAHWGIEDPAAVEGPETAQRTAFEAAFRFIKARMDRLLALPLLSMSDAEIRDAMREIGEIEGASFRTTA